MKYAIVTEMFCDDISTETVISRDIPQEWIFGLPHLIFSENVCVYMSTEYAKNNGESHPACVHATSEDTKNRI